MWLDVSDGHRIYYEEHGNSQGKPVVVLHGGPGGGLQRPVLRLFNTRQWRVILYDQRGCGRSTPSAREPAGLRANTTWHLVADLERLRVHLELSSWTLFGGSWGSTLALAYAARHMDHIDGMILRGICLMEPWESRWMYGPEGAARLFPTEWQRFASVSGPGSLMRTYKRRLADRKTRRRAARAWWNWEAGLSHLIPRPDRTAPATVETLALLENHYFSRNAWIRPGQLLAAARRIPRSIPVHIVQGRYDLICPAASAIALSTAIPHATLTVVPDAGHAASEPGIAKALRQATDAYNS